VLLAATDSRQVNGMNRRKVIRSRTITTLRILDVFLSVKEEKGGAGHQIPETVTGARFGGDCPCLGFGANAGYLGFARPGDDFLSLVLYLAKLNTPTGFPAPLLDYAVLAGLRWDIPGDDSPESSSMGLPSHFRAERLNKTCGRIAWDLDRTFNSTRGKNIEPLQNAAFDGPSRANWYGCTVDWAGYGGSWPCLTSPKKALRPGGVGWGAALDTDCLRGQPQITRLSTEQEWYEQFVSKHSLEVWYLWGAKPIDLRLEREGRL
jgi:hypothetical protein